MGVDELRALLDGPGHPYDLPSVVTALSTHSVDVRDVRRVLIGHSWFDVHDSSLEVDHAGFVFRSGDTVIAGPISSLTAVAASSAAPSVGERQSFSPGPSRW